MTGLRCERRYDIFDRTGEELNRAYQFLADSGSSGENRDLIEVAVCADCGWWERWDSELQRPGMCSHPSGRHLITRVQVKPIAPRKPR